MDPRLFDLTFHAKAYIIAELSANHGQDLQQALLTIEAAAEAGADAIKLQTYTADTLTLDCDRPEFIVGRDTLWEGRKLYDLYQEAHTPWDWHPQLFAKAHSLRLDCFSTPFDPTAVDFLEQFDPPAYKVASFELIDLPLIEKIASKNRPVIMSTGMGSLSEIEAAVSVVKQSGCPLILLKCTSAYPAAAETMHLNTIPHLSQTFGVPAGLSDHTMGIAAPVAAVALGARVIEKHFTLSRDQPGPDSAFSLEPSEFKSMVDAIRFTESALGSINYSGTEKEQASRVFRRSLYAVADIKAGETFTQKNIRSIRPANGLPPKYLGKVLNRTAKIEVKRGTPLSWDLIE